MKFNIIIQGSLKIMVSLLCVGAIFLLMAGFYVAALILGIFLLGCAKVLDITVELTDDI